MISSRSADLRSIRRELHAKPELSGEEHQTAAYIEQFLAPLGLNEIRTSVGGAGILAVLEGGQPGPTTLLRADMDALPVQEQTGLSFASAVPGRMHACGHDAHMSILLNSIVELASQREKVRGTLVFCFQPAEEGADGAKKMLADATLTRPRRVDRCFALHVYTGLKAGLVGVRDNAFFASSDKFEILLRGRGAHGAMPERAIDPIVAGAHLVTALQTIVSREVAPKDIAVVSVGYLHSGSAFNIIPDTAVLGGTVRCFDPAIRAAIPDRIARIANGIAAAFRVEAECSYEFGCPSLINNPEVNAVARRAAQSVLGAEHVIEHDVVGWAEDMALFQEECPGAYFLVGARGEDPSTQHPHHSPFFNIDEEALDVGYKMMVGIGLGLGDAGLGGVSV